MPLPKGVLKLNIDASVLPNAKFIRVGGVIQDANGEVLRAFSKQILG